MNRFDGTTAHQTHSARPVPNPTYLHTDAESSAAGASLLAPPHFAPRSVASATVAKRARPPKLVRRLLPNRKTGWTVATALTAAALGLASCSTTSTSATATSPPTGAGQTSSPSTGQQAGGGSNARSGPAAGGAAGTVSSIATSSFTISTSAGQKVTVNETSSTTFQKGTSTATASAVTTGIPVLVLGTTSGTTITATQVTTQPTGAGASATASSAQVVPFQRGAPSTAKQVGQIPSYTEGQGTIVSGTTADKATVAALVAYPGGVVDRVVQLGGGEYEVHYIGVNWPHHIFVNQSFSVVGAS